MVLEYQSSHDTKNRFLLVEFREARLLWFYRYNVRQLTEHLAPMRLAPDDPLTSRRAEGEFGARRETAATWPPSRSPDRPWGPDSEGRMRPPGGVVATSLGRWTFPRNLPQRVTAGAAPSRPPAQRTLLRP